MTTIRPAVRILPSMLMNDPCRGFARLPDVETDAGKDHGDQDDRDRAQEEARAPDRKRFEQRVLRNGSQDDADDEGRARPVMALEEVANAAKEDEQDKVFPRPGAEITAKQSQ